MAKFTGFVNWYKPEKGYGFISKFDGTNVFVCWKDIKDRKPLQPEQIVEFDEETANDGKIRAVNVVVMEEGELNGTN
jgi:cold shock protein